MTGKLTFAAQCIDRRAWTDSLNGQQVEVVTGRALLHALAADGWPLCGTDSGELRAFDEEWSAGYLPHLPRCRYCAAARPAAGTPGPARPAVRARPGEHAGPGSAGFRQH